MDLFDIVAPTAPGPGAPRDGNRARDLTGGLVAFGLPLLALAMLTVTDLSKQPMTAMVWMPAGFTALGACTCLLTGLGAWRTFVTSLACLWWCLVASVALVVIDIMIFPF